MKNNQPALFVPTSLILNEDMEELYTIDTHEEFKGLFAPQIIRNLCPLNANTIIIENMSGEVYALNFHSLKMKFLFLNKALFQSITRINENAFVGANITELRLYDFERGDVRKVDTNFHFSNVDFIYSVGMNNNQFAVYSSNNVIALYDTRQRLHLVDSFAITLSTNKRMLHLTDSVFAVYNFRQIIIFDIHSKEIIVDSKGVNITAEIIGNYFVSVSDGPAIMVYDIENNFHAYSIQINGCTREVNAVGNNMFFSYHMDIMYLILISSGDEVATFPSSDYVPIRSIVINDDKTCIISASRSNERKCYLYSKSSNTLLEKPHVGWQLYSLRVKSHRSDWRRKPFIVTLYKNRNYSDIEVTACS
jgi:hypothetical protein